jgi:signal recognition particle subunit SRP54
VNVGVVRSVLARIRDKAVGVEVSKALDPAQQVVKTVHAELIGLLGGETLLSSDGSFCRIFLRNLLS